MTWNTMDTLPQDRPVMLAAWTQARKYDGVPARWEYQGVYRWREAPPHDVSVVAVSDDGLRWLRGGITVSGINVLDRYRWADITALPEQPLE